MMRKGFSILELMVVVAILAILVGIAIPAYQAYLYRGKVTELFSQFTYYRDLQNEYYALNGEFGNAGTLGIGSGTSDTSTDFSAKPNLTSATINSDGTIIVEGAEYGSPAETMKLKFTPTVTTQGGSVSIEWTCSVEAGETSYAPVDCQ